MKNELMVDVTLGPKTMAQIEEFITQKLELKIKHFVDSRIEELEAAVCWLARSLVESEGTIVQASHMDREACHTFIRETMPVTVGINENRLIVSLSKHSPNTIPMKVLMSILAEKEES